MKVADHLARVKRTITDLEIKYGREPGSVTLLAVSKGQSETKFIEAFQAGQRKFGESYVNEACSRINNFADKNIEWHFIGPIQANKTKKIAENFHWVHSVASLKVAKRLNDHRPVHLPPLNICIEVNVSQEATKAGIDPAQTLLLAKYCLALPNLNLAGLMALPIPTHDLASQRREFYKLVQIKRQLEQAGIPIHTLSMGMSNDFEAAIAEGSTLVRIGTAIFGPRVQVIR